MRLSAMILTAATLACAPPMSTTDNGAIGDNGGRQQVPDENNDNNGGNGDNPTPPGDLLDPGSRCDCSSECWGTDENPGICVLGLCMQAAAGECAEAGSRSECDSRSRCWGAEGLEGSICWPDANAYDCQGDTDGAGSCVPTAEDSCDATCSDFCERSNSGGGDVNRCDAITCPDGQLCDPSSGRCIETDQNLPAGSPPDCARDVPSYTDCDPRGGDNSCAELIQFDPVRELGYWDYPLNGETERDQYRSWARRDLMLLIRRATAATQCLSEDWEYQAYQDLGLGDMSERDGSIPGTREGRPGHPQGTHTNGHDMDIAYYQVGQRNNWLRSVCEHVQNGQDQYRCVADPVILDVYRTALFIGRLHDTPYLRVIGVDGKVGPLVRNAVAQLCGAGWLRNSACRQLKLAYEVENEGQGWYNFHHHHLHISLSAPTRGW